MEYTSSFYSDSSVELILQSDFTDPTTGEPGVRYEYQIKNSAGTYPVYCTTVGEPAQISSFNGQVNAL